MVVVIGDNAWCSGDLEAYLYLGAAPTFTAGARPYEAYTRASGVGCPVTPGRQRQIHPPSDSSSRLSALTM